MAVLPRVFLEAPIAHRALHDAALGIPENSRAAIGRAIEAGYGVELDIQLSADGVAMVFHDATLDRMTSEHGPIKAQSAEALGRIRLIGSDETIPTLAEVLAQISGRVPLLLELKDQSDCLGPGEDRLERAVAADLAGYGGPVAVMSFNPSMVGAMQRLAPEVPRGLTTCAFDPAAWPQLTPEACTALRSIRAFGPVGARFISHDWRDLGSPRVAELRNNETPILCWTITNPDSEHEARRVAENITFEGYLPDLTHR